MYPTAEDYKKVGKKKKNKIDTQKRDDTSEQLTEETEKTNGNLRSLVAKRSHDSPYFYCMLALLRVYLATIQTGYVHPDEFHQSLQVISYDILDIDAVKPWEFTTTTPIRSVLFLGIISLPVYLLKFLNPYSKYLLDVELLTPRYLLLFPRLFMTLLSFIADICVFKIASKCYVRPWQCLEVFAGSYIMLVYATRTFTNSIELILQALLLWRVCLSIVHSTKVLRRENILQDLYESVDTMKDKVKIVRTKGKLPYYNFTDCVFISVIVTLGFFIRPTFILFSFIPVSYWLQRGVVTGELSFSYFNWRYLSLLPGAIITFTLCVLADSFYYGSITFTELVFWNVTATSFTVAPFNFILYNANATNLASHGAHPYLMHIGVNIPLLFGILGLIGLWMVSKYISNLLFKRFTLKPKIYSLSTMLLGSFVVPILALSAIPHQEARFLLPTLIPLVLLNSDKVSIYALQKFKFTKHFFFLTWQIWNILCVVFYGFLHQGAITNTMLFLHDHVASHEHTMNFHVFFSHMYTPPTFLLMQKIPIVSTTESGKRYKVERKVSTYDLGGSLRMEDIFERMQHVQRTHEEATILLCITASVSEQLQRSTPVNTTSKRIARLPGHLSFENFPNLIIGKKEITEDCNELCLVTKRIREFSVDVFEINYLESRRADELEKSDILEIIDDYDDDIHDEL